MTKQVQLAGGPADEQDAYIGLEREVTVDESNWELRLHDGVEPGGRRILNRDANDQRYQARSEELDGLLEFEPSNRGFLARLGPSTYRLRSLTVNIENLVIDNEDGYDGDPIIGLAPTVASDHTWTGAHTFDQAIQAEGGVVGDVEGNTTGTHTGNVVGDVVGDSGTFTGSADFSGGTVEFAPGAIPLAALADDVIDYILLNSAPILGIIPFHGDIVDVPGNWWPCDGTNGTPDLRDRFVLAAGPVNAVDSFGGVTIHSHSATIDAGGAHSHTGTSGNTVLTINQMPAHTHLNGVVDKNDNLFNHGGAAASPTMANSIDGNSSDGTREGTTTSAGSGDPHNHTVSIDSGGAHTHTATTSNATNLPPFFTKLYIMRIS
jgi:hypothetical protein